MWFVSGGSTNLVWIVREWLAVICCVISIPPVGIWANKKPTFSGERMGWINVNNRAEIGKKPLHRAEYLRYTSQLPEKVINL
jgi:hypothetical protein